MDDPRNVLGKFFYREQVKVEVLGPAPDGGQDLLRVRCGQHEHDVGRGLLQRLEQRGRGSGGEHVDFVEDVHLGAAGRTQRHPADEISDIADTVVGGGI